MTTFNKDQYLICYANIALVKGASRSVIMDFQRDDYHFVPNALIDLLNENNKKPVLNIFENLDEEDKKTVAEYLDFLLEIEAIYLCGKDELDFFPEMSKKWEIPAHISNAIIDLELNSVSYNNFEKIISELDALNCNHLEIRSYNSDFSEKALIDLLKALDNTTIISVEIVIKDYLDIDSYKRISEEIKRVKTINLHSSSNGFMNYNHKGSSINTLSQKISSNSCCGNISPNNFTIDMNFWIESLNFNSCLNKKVSVDINGDLKNCPTHKSVYGNIVKDNIGDIVLMKEFIEKRKITKDQVDTCKVCEFRYMCVDCRVITEGDDQFAKPAKCSYDPHKMEWGDIASNSFKIK